VVGVNRVRVGRSRSENQTCPWCRLGLAEGEGEGPARVWTCPRDATLMHSACAEQFGSCATCRAPYDMTAPRPKTRRVAPRAPVLPLIEEDDSWGAVFGELFKKIAFFVVICVCALGLVYSFLEIFSGGEGGVLPRVFGRLPSVFPAAIFASVLVLMTRIKDPRFKE
jgi:hypothetical protein